MDDKVKDKINQNKKLSGEDIAETLGDFVNSFGHDSEGFVNGITKLHRTSSARCIPYYAGYH